MSLMDKLKKNSTIKDTAILTESKFFQTKDLIQTSVPALNVALSGRLDGGLTPGLTVFAGPSKHFKTAFSLLLAKSYLDKYDDAIVLFYDSEFGTPQAYFDTFNIDTSRVIHTPITDIEQLKHDVMSQMNGIERGDHVIVVIDSVGNLASKKEVEDALDGKSVADMTRAKQMKSLFRMVTPHLTIKDIPMVVVNHTYQTMEMFSKAVVSGGTGIYYSADAIWIVGRQQDKVGTEIQGYHFVINIEKSRHVKEKSKIPISVSWEGGIVKWSGLMDVAEKGGYLRKPKVGWYEAVDPSTGEIISEKLMRAKEVNDNGDFWRMVFEKTDFKEFIRKNFTIGASGSIMRENNDVTDIEEIEEMDEAN